MALEIFLFVSIVGAVIVGFIQFILYIINDSKPTKLDRNNKRELKINRINFWDYLVIICPLVLLLIALLSSDSSEKISSFMLLGIGLAFLFLTSYNNRMYIPQINRMALSISLLIGIVALVLFIANVKCEMESGFNSITVLFFPIITYCYLFISVKLIRYITKTYPVTVDKTFPMGSFSYRFGRKTNFWDLVWSLWNMFVIPLLVLFCV